MRIEVLSWPDRCGDAIAADQHEARLVLGMILNVGGKHLQAVDLTARFGAIAAVSRRPLSANSRAASAVELVASIAAWPSWSER